VKELVNEYTNRRSVLYGVISRLN